MVARVRPDLPAKRSLGPLPALLWLMVGLAAVAVAYVLLSAATREASYDPWVTVDTSDFAPGERRTITVEHDAYTLHRLLPEDLRRAAALPSDRLNVSQEVNDRITMVPVAGGTDFAPFVLYRLIDNRGFCRVARVDGKDGTAWVDPCHGSTFDVLGRGLKGPARELPQPMTRLRGGQLQLATEEGLRRTSR